jgi:hypothetical protein
MINRVGHLIIENMPKFAKNACHRIIPQANDSPFTLIKKSYYCFILMGGASGAIVSKLTDMPVGRGLLFGACSAAEMPYAASRVAISVLQERILDFKK